MYQDLVGILESDIVRNRERYAEAAAEGRPEDAALYAGKEAEARRIMALMAAGRMGMVTLVRLPQRPNACCPMVVTPSGMTTSARLLHS